MSNDPHWIEHAHLKKGALHKALGVPEGKKIPEAKISKAASAGGRLGRMAHTAQVLSKLPHH